MSKLALRTQKHRVKLLLRKPDHCRSSVRAGKRVFCPLQLLEQAPALFATTHSSGFDRATAGDDPRDLFTPAHRSLKVFSCKIIHNLIDQVSLFEPTQYDRDRTH
jgi:hypothetical protein